MKRIFCFLLPLVLVCTQVHAGFLLDPYSVVTASGTTCTGNIGDESDGTNYKSSSNTYMAVALVPFGCTAGAGDATLNVRFRNVHTDTREAIFVIYEDNAGEPGDVIWSSSATYWSGDSPDISTWHSVTVSAALSGTNLWIGAIMENSVVDSDLHYVSGSEVDSRWVDSNETFPTVPGSWPSGSTEFTSGLSAYFSF